MFSSCLQVENVSMEGSKPVFSTRKAKTADSFAQERNGVKKEFKLHDPGRGKECKRTTYGVLLISVICKHDHVLLYCLCANVHTHHYSYSFICYVVCMIISVYIDIFADTSKLLYVHIQFEFTFRTVSILLIGLQYYY